MQPSPTRIAVSVQAPTAAAQAAAARALPACVGLVEMRLDFLAPDASLRGLFDVPLPAIATCRRPRDGGRFAGSEEERRRMLQRAVEAGAAFVDVEDDVLPVWQPSGPARLIASHHDFRGCPEDVDARLAALAAKGIPKLAVRIREPLELARLLALARARPGSIVIGMGALGVATRLAAAAVGGFLSFASHGPPSGPGQVPAAQLAAFGFDRPPPAGLRGLVGADVEEAAAANRAGGELLAVPLPAHPWEEALPVLETAGFVALRAADGRAWRREQAGWRAARV